MPQRQMRRARGVLQAGADEECGRANDEFLQVRQVREGVDGEFVRGELVVEVGQTGIRRSRKEVRMVKKDVIRLAV